MKKLVKIICAVLITAVFAAGFSGCEKSETTGSREFSGYDSFRDIPGLSKNEIAAIEKLQREMNENDYFVYAMLPGTEAFYDENGEIKGYAPLFCDWLTKLFDIEFKTELYIWSDLTAGLETGEIDFAGDLTATEERRGIYYMTDAIAERPVIIIRIDGANEDLYNASESRLLKFGFLEGSVTVGDVSGAWRGEFTQVEVNGRAHAYEMLKNGEIDAFFDEKPAELVFESYKDIIIEDFFPMLISSASMATAKPELSAVISVVQKALDNGARRHLIELYNKGYDYYRIHKLIINFTDEEREFINNSPPVKFLAETENYPVSFYDEHTKQWHGIAIDALDGITKLTGLEFEIINGSTYTWPILLAMLENGEGAMVSELIRNEDRAGRFLWPETPLMKDKYILITVEDYPHVNINEIFYAKIGLLDGTAYAQAFQDWFPSHPNTVYYEGTESAFEALKKGEIDMVMSSEHKLLTLTHFQELTGYKANVAFDYVYESTFGININEPVLCSVVDKTLAVIDMSWISEQWMRKTYDYKVREMQSRLPVIIGVIIIACILLFMIIFIQRNISEEKRLEQLVTERTNELESKTSVLKAVFDSSPDLIFCMDLDLNYVQINKSMEEHFNVKESDVLGKPDGTALNMPQEAAKAVTETDKKVIRDKAQHIIEEVIPSPDGRDVYFETTKSPLWQNGEMTGILGIAHDITRRKTMEEEAKAASVAKSAFLASMSHELRTPLNVIIGLTDLTIDEEGISEHVKSNLVSISNAGGTLLSIVNDILDISKIESGKLIFVPVKYHMPSLLNDTVIFINTYIGEKPIELRLDVNERLPAMLYGDEVRVKQIMNNILSNAIKYTREGTVTLSVSCERVDNGDYNYNDIEGEMWLDISVEDTGIGIREDDLKKLFSEYYQADAKANRKIEGTGLGLSITRRMAEMMGGNISVKSEYGKGSVFSVRIKQGYINDEIIGLDIIEKLRGFNYSDVKRETAHKLVRADLSYARVLVVDDIKNNLDVAAGLMRKYNLKVDCLLSGKAAIERIQAGEPVYNAVFMDHMMPEMDGIETVHAIRALDGKYAREVPIIALTANAVSGMDKMFLENGFQDFLSKPIDIILLDAILKKWVRKRETGEPAKTVGTPYMASGENNIDDEKDIDINIPGLNAKEGISRYGGDSEIYIHVLRSFISNAPEVLDKLRNVKAESLKDNIINAHSLKGISANISAEQVRSQAAKMEAAARNGDFAAFFELSGPLIKDAEILLENIKSWFEQYDKANEKPRRKSPDKELLIKLRKSCEAYDMSGIDGAMDELESAGYETGADLIEWLREKIDMMELDEVIEKLKSQEDL